jgi:hypothetical protein
VLIAVVFLAIIGASAGWVIGNRAEVEENAGRTGTQLPAEPPAAEDQGGGGEPGDDGQGGEPGGGDDGGGEPEVLSPDRCPAHTVKLAQENGSSGGLTRVLYIRTARAQVWICADDSGTLFYQGHQWPKDERLVEGTNALFLTDVTRDGQSYVATNRTSIGTTVYRVSRERLTQGDGGPDDEVQIVQRHAG